MLVVIAILSFLTVFILILSLAKGSDPEREMILKRLFFWEKTDVSTGPINEKLQKPFKERIIRPLLLYLSEISGQWVPAQIRTKLQQKLILAGTPGGLGSGEFITLQLGSAVILGILLLTLGQFLHWSFKTKILMILVGTSFGYLIPELLLKNQIKKRQQIILHNLPDILDLLTVSVEAGLGFDGALFKVTEKSKGILSQEFNRVLQEIRMGKSRREALRDLADRIQVEELSALVSSIIQADQLGVSMGNVLRLQSAQIRLQRRQRAEEKAMKAPIKMLIPLLLFIFPTIFLVLLGPAAIQILKAFK